MRRWTAAQIARWTAGGPFIGTDGAPHARITVEKNWALRTSFDSDGLNSYWPKIPVRWFQRLDDDQVETEIPNVENLEVASSVDQDAATMNFTITNQKHRLNDEANVINELGQPGFYTWARGDSAEGALRWGHEQAATTTHTFFPDNAPGQHFDTSTGGADVWETQTGAIPTYAVLNSKTDLTTYLTNIVDTNWFYGSGVPGSKMTFHSNGYTPFAVDTEIVSVTIKTHLSCFTTTAKTNISDTWNTGGRNPLWVVPYFKIGGTEYRGTGTSVAGHEAYCSSGEYVENPATGVPWTVADVNAFISGGSGDSFGLSLGWFIMHEHDVDIYGVWLEVVTAPSGEWWGNVLVPNALIRTYEGYGGHDKTLANALGDGNLIQTGTWLVDDIRVTANGKLQVNCRDMAKLLIEQSLFPPLVPYSAYPVRYGRYDHLVLVGQKLGIADPGVTLGWFLEWYTMSYNGSSTDVNHGSYNSLVNGHQPADAADQNPDTYWQTDAHVTADNWEYIQFQCPAGADVSWFTVHPWGGNYRAYCSVYKAGAWLGANTIPGPAGMNIPYVSSQNFLWETEKQAFTIGQFLQPVLDVEYVRITITNLVQMSVDGELYRGGIREVRGVRYYDATADNRYITAGSGAKYQSRLGFNAQYDLLDNTGHNYLFGIQGQNAHQKGDAGTFIWAIPLYDNRGPTVANVTLPRGLSSYTVTANGYVSGFGIASPNNNLGNAVVGASTVAGIAHNLTLETNQYDPYGYWIVLANGNVQDFGNAVNYGNFSAGGTVIGITAADDGLGYWIANSAGVVQAFGSATLSTDANTSQGAIVDIKSGIGQSYYLLANTGYVWAFGAGAPFFGHGSPLSATPYAAAAIIPSPAVLSETATPVWEITGYWIARTNGNVQSFGDQFNTPFLGSLDADYSLVVTTNGNYRDYADVIKDLLLWSGWWLKDSTTDGYPDVYGNIETTGAWATDVIPESVFDKQKVIDAINKIKESIGYIFRVDGTGAAHFELPNYWVLGNYYETGEHTAYTPQIDEAIQMTDYGVSFNDKAVVSEIVISSNNPIEPLDDTVTTVYVPPNANVLRGVVRNALWTNEVFLNPTEQKLMAEMIGVHSWFAQRQGQVTCAANPTIEIDDQVQLWERQTGETYRHYVRGVNRSFDFASGQYTMQLTTHWLGDGENFAIELMGDVPDRIPSNSILQIDGGAGLSQDPPSVIGGSNQQNTGFTVGWRMAYELSGLQFRVMNIMENTGAVWARFDLDFSVIGAVQGSYDWTAIDDMIERFEDRGMRMIANLTGTPNWAQPANGTKYSPPAVTQNFVNFALAAANRYGTRIEVYEIWAKANDGSFWYPSPNAAAYTALFIATVTALTSVQATPAVANVLLGTLVQADTNVATPSTVAPEDFLQGVYNAGGGSYFDNVAIALYPYPYGPSDANPLNPVNDIPAIRAVMTGEGDAAKDIWLTEAGVPTGTASVAVSEATQATYVADFFTEWFALGYAGPLLWFQPRDNGVDSGEVSDNFGLVTKAWRVKAAYAAWITQVES